MSSSRPAIRGLFRSITDCGAGGFSSAVGEMGAELGAEVELTAPLKYPKACRTPRSGSPRPRSGWSWPSRREDWPALQELCEA